MTMEQHQPNPSGASLLGWGIVGAGLLWLIFKPKSTTDKCDYSPGKLNEWGVKNGKLVLMLLKKEPITLDEWQKKVGELPPFGEPFTEEDVVMVTSDNRFWKFDNDGKYYPAPEIKKEYCAFA